MDRERKGHQTSLFITGALVHSMFYFPHSLLVYIYIRDESYESSALSERKRTLWRIYVLKYISYLLPPQVMFPSLSQANDCGPCFPFYKSLANKGIGQMVKTKFPATISHAAIFKPSLVEQPLLTSLYTYTISIRTDI